MGDNEELWQIVNSGEIVTSNTPKELWDLACKYFLWCDTHPVKRKRLITNGKSAGTSMDEQTQRPYTIKGLCLTCGIMEEYLRDLRNSPDKNNLYYIVASKIMYIIYDQNQTYATTGIFNPIFTAKVLNMDTEELPNEGIQVTIMPGLPTLSNTENEILEKLDLELQQSQNTKEQNS